VGDTASTAASAEDFRFVSENLVVLGVSSILRLYSHPLEFNTEGKLVAVDLETEQTKTLELVGFPTGVRFVPHGIDVRHFDLNIASLWVVNHVAHGEDRIEIFTLSGVGALDTIRATWIGFQALQDASKWGTNAVTGVNEDLYVTNWLSFDTPEKGLDPDSPLTVLRFVFQFLINPVVGPLGLPPFTFGLTKIVRCDTLSESCALAVPNFVSANGICTSPNGDMVFAVDFSL
jgi:hypothetical protein